jgi:hypothetical protein
LRNKEKQMTEVEVFDLMGYADEQAEEGAGEFSYVGEVRVRPGWFALGQGNPNDRFFPFTSQAESDASKEQAQKLIAARGWSSNGGRPTVAFQIELFADSILGQDEIPVWEGGSRSWFLTGFSQAYRGEEDEETGEMVGGFKQSFAPKAAGYAGEKFWARLTLVQDPYRPTYTKDGKIRKNFVPVISEFFDTQEDAQAATNDTGVRFPAAPAEWDPANGAWAGYAQAIYDAAARGDSVELFAQPSNGVTVAVLKEIEEMAREDDLPF